MQTEKGLSQAERSHRYNMLEWNKDKIVNAFRQADFPDPVVIVADANDRYGKEVAVVNLIMEGMTAEDASALVEKRCQEHAARGEFPTYIMLATYEFAAKIMPMTSPTGAKSIESIRRAIERESDIYLAIGIAADGNTYQVYRLDGMKMASDYRRRAAQDGQHRHSVDEYIRRQTWNNRRKRPR